MAFMTKEIREGKDLYAAKQHEKNIRIAVDNGCPEKQAETIAKLCSDRHYIHTNSSSAFLSESADGNKINELLSNQLDMGINKYLEEADLPRIDFTYDYDNDILDDETYELFDMSYEEAEMQTDDIMEQYDKDILEYLKKFDEKYKCHFRPTGVGRLLGEENLFDIKRK